MALEGPCRRWGLLGLDEARAASERAPEADGDGQQAPTRPCPSEHDPPRVSARAGWSAWGLRRRRHLHTSRQSAPPACIAAPVVWPYASRAVGGIEVDEARSVISRRAPTAPPEQVPAVVVGFFDHTRCLHAARSPEAFERRTSLPGSTGCSNPVQNSSNAAIVSQGHDSIERMVGLRVGELVAGLEEVLAELNAEALGASESLELVAAFARLQRLGAAGTVLCSRRMAESPAWFSTGHRSPAHVLAEAAGSGSGRRWTCWRRPGHAGACRPQRRGPAPVRSPSARSSRWPAPQSPMRARKRRCWSWPRPRPSPSCNGQARVRAAATDDDERHRRAHRRRHLRHWVDLEGSFRFSGSLTPEAGAIVMAALEPHRQAITRRAADEHRGRSRKRREADSAVAADALVAMARAATASPPADALRPPSAMIHVRVDHGALRRGRSERGEVCEVPGAGPVPVGWVNGLLADAARGRAEVDDGEVRKVVHLGRGIPARVRARGGARNPVCVVPGCGVAIAWRSTTSTPWPRAAAATGQPLPPLPVPPLPEDPSPMARLPAGPTLAMGGEPRPPSRPPGPPTRADGRLGLERARPAPGATNGRRPRPIDVRAPPGGDRSRPVAGGSPRCAGASLAPSAAEQERHRASDPDAGARMRGRSRTGSTCRVELGGRGRTQPRRSGGRRLDAEPRTSVTCEWWRGARPISAGTGWPRAYFGASGTANP